jgi:hypothetical protein
MQSPNFPSLIIRFLPLLLIVAAAGCDWFGEDNVTRSPCSLDGHPSFTQFQDFRDFGCEKGYFIYTADKTKIPWTRNRNFVSIEFVEAISQEDLLGILNEYDLFYHSQVYPVKHVLARVIKKPAENYYTSYGDSTLSRLGNIIEVKYALPVYMNEFGDPVMITDRIRIRFDKLEMEQEIAVIDSLISSDQLIRGPEGPSDPIRYSLIVTKSSPYDPLLLSNHYAWLDHVRFALPDYAFMIHPKDLP